MQLPLAPFAGALRGGRSDVDMRSMPGSPSRRRSQLDESMLQSLSSLSPRSGTDRTHSFREAGAFVHPRRAAQPDGEATIQWSPMLSASPEDHASPAVDDLRSASIEMTQDPAPAARARIFSRVRKLKIWLATASHIFDADMGDHVGTPALKRSTSGPPAPGSIIITEPCDGVGQLHSVYHRDPRAEVVGSSAFANAARRSLSLETALRTNRSRLPTLHRFPLTLGVPDELDETFAWSDEDASRALVSLASASTAADGGEGQCFVSCVKWEGTLYITG